MGFFNWLKNSRLVFGIKANLSNNSYLGEIFYSGLDKLDDEAAKKILKYEIDEEKFASIRQETSDQILNLRTALYTEEGKPDIKIEINNKLNSLTQEYFVDFLDKELKDINEIVELSKKIIENEYLLTLYDIRLPLNTFIKYQKELRTVFKNVKLPREYNQHITNILDDITKNHVLIIKHTMDLSNEIRLTGLPNSSSGLINAIFTRTTAKKRLSGQANQMVEELDKLREQFKIYKKNKLINKKEADSIINNLEQFKISFDELVTFCKNRTDSSGTLIAEARLLQKKKLEDLQTIHAQIKIIKEKQNNKNKENDENKISQVINAYGKEVTEEEKNIKTTQRQQDSIQRRILNNNNQDLRKLETEEQKTIKSIKNKEFNEDSLNYIYNDEHKLVNLALKYQSEQLWYKDVFDTLLKISQMNYGDELMEKYPDYFIKTSKDLILKITITKTTYADALFAESQTGEILCMRVLNTDQKTFGNNITGTIVVRTPGLGIASAVEKFTGKYLSYKYSGRKWVIEDQNLKNLKRIKEKYEKNPSKELKKIIELKEIEHERWLAIYGNSGRMGFARKDEETYWKEIPPLGNDKTFDFSQKQEIVNKAQQITNMTKKIEGSLGDNGAQILANLSSEDKAKIRSYF